tara:strand:+ start:483 stop:689 length:207 start_codon:yes stop_codon:yes gene_type:complete
MGNRYTRTTLTGREFDTIRGCYLKLADIYFRRKDKPNEVAAPIRELLKAVLALEDVQTEVTNVRSEQE